MNASSECYRALPYFIGCPVWNWTTWRGSIYPPRAAQKKWLHYYSTKFNCVEGNSTFYGIPTVETAERWGRETVDGFRFALKFPRTISHDNALVGAELETEAFLKVLSALASADRIGPTFLQLSPYFSPKQFPALENYLRKLPVEFPYAVEVRHPAWFEPEMESRLDSLLGELSIDRVVFDSRPLFSSPATDESEVKSRERKPQVPIRKQGISQFPILRLIGRNQVSKVDPWVDEWTDQVKIWIEEGRTPFVFTHAPDDEFAPQLAKRFHSLLRKKMGKLASLPEWEPPAPQQLGLFG